MTVSEKIRAIKELAEVVQQFVYPPPEGNEPADVQRLRASAEIVKGLGDLAVRLQAIEHGARETAALAQAIESELKKTQVMAVLALVAALAAALVAALF